MLSIKRDKRGFLEVKETMMSWTNDRITYWYYDTEKWLKTRAGKEGDTPDQVCTKADIDWATRHYLPKLLDAQKPAPVLNSAFDPRSTQWSNAVTYSMVEDDFYAGHTRPECALEWRQRYDAMKKAAGPLAVELRADHVK